MFTYQNSNYKGEVRLKDTSLGNFELVSPEGQLVVVGSEAGELVDLVELTPGLKWEQEEVNFA